MLIISCLLKYVFICNNTNCNIYIYIYIYRNYMWFHKTGRFAVGDNGKPSIYIAYAVHSEHLKLIG